MLGATKGMGRAVARRFAERGDAVFLLGRGGEDLDRSARDIEVRGGRAAGSVGTADCDLERPGRLRGRARRGGSQRSGASTPWS